MGFVRRALLFALTAVVLDAAVVRGQTISQVDTPAHIATVDGQAIIDREGQSEPPLSGMPMVAGDRLRTEGGRVEVLFPDGTSLDLDEFSSVELQAPTLLRVTGGRILLTVAGAANPSSAAHFQIDTPTASATTDGPGEYRISILSGPSGVQTEFAILRGTGALMTELGSMPLRAGERSVAWDNAAPSVPQAFNSARFDAFDRWAAARRETRLGSTASAQYLPSELRMYGGTLDRSGSWQYEAPYGNVWYPTVAEDWRPYYNGTWASVPSYGWTWVGADVWSWPTHHYGRWGHARSRWFWIPDKRWAAAWVSWGGAPGYVGWCPLGYDNRPVFGLSVRGGAGLGWVTVSRSNFGHGRNVRRYAVSPRRLPGAHIPLVAQAGPPIGSSRATSRNGSPRGNASVGIAVPRNGAVPGQPGATPMRRPSANGSIGPAVPRNGAVPRQPGTTPIERPSLTGRNPAYRGQPDRPYAVERQPRGADPVSTPRAGDRRRNSPGTFKEPLQPSGVQRTVPRELFPNGVAPPDAGTGRSRINPAYQVPSGRPSYERRTYGRTPGPVGGATQPATVAPAPGPVRSPYMLSAPLGPPAQSPFMQPAPVQSGASARPRAVPRGAPSGGIAPAQPSPQPPAGQDRAASRAAPRQATPGAASGTAAAPRQHDRGARRPR